MSCISRKLFLSAPTFILCPLLPCSPLTDSTSIRKRSTFGFAAQIAMDNATFASQLCTAFDDFAATSSGSISQIDISNGNFPIVEVPECLWASPGLYSPTLTYLYFSNVILLGNGNGTSDVIGPGSSNPLMRFPARITGFGADRTVFADPTNASFAPDLQAFIDRYPLTYFQVGDSDFGGALVPTSIPPQMNILTIANSGLTGTISPALFGRERSLAQLNVEFTGNQITGSIPDALFNITSSTSFVSYTIDFSNNELTGSIPETLFSDALDSPFRNPNSYFSFVARSNLLSGPLPASFTGCPSSMTLDLSDNQLSGSISSSMLDSCFAQKPRYIQFYARNNSFTGAAPALFANMPPQSGVKRSESADDLARILTLVIDFSYNKLSSVGLNVVANASVDVASLISINLAYNEIANALPAHFLDSYTPNLIIDLTGNKIPGTIPSAFFTATRAYSGITVSLGYNLLTSIASDIFVGLGARQGVSFNVTNNPTLTGSLPSSLTYAASSNFISYTLDFSHCGYTGAIPNMPFSYESTAILNFAGNRLNNGSQGLLLSNFLNTSFDSALAGLELDISDNLFEGVLNVTGLPSAHHSAMSDNSGFSLNASGNSFTKLAYDNDWASVTNSLDLSRNTLLTDSNLPVSIFSNTSRLKTLRASKTGIIGVFPALGDWDAPFLVELDFSDSTGIDFCSGTRSPWTNPESLQVCQLYHTTAANCTNKYPSICAISAIEVPPTAPVAPVAPGTPSSMPAAPGTPSAAQTPTRPPTGAASETSFSFFVIAFAALLALVASL